MNTLILVRHGVSHDNELTDRGREQIRKLAELLDPLVRSKKAIVLTSTVERAAKSAQFLASLLGRLPCTLHDELSAEKKDYGAMLRLIKEKGKDVDIVVVVMHGQTLEEFAVYYGMHELHASPFWLNQLGSALDHGEAKVILIGSNSCFHIPKRT